MTPDRNLVRRLRDAGETGGPVATNVLDAVDRVLAITVPPLYRALLERLGHFEAGAIEFAGATVGLRPDLDIVQLNLNERTSAHVPERLLVVANDGGSALLCLDWQLGDKSPVLAWDLHRFSADETNYATTFADWLLELLAS